MARLQVEAEYLGSLAKSFNPWAYRELSIKPFKRSFGYLGFLMIFALLLALIILIPIFTSMPDAIEGKLSDFSEFKIDLKVETNRPISLLPLRLSIDTLSNSTGLGDSNVYISGKSITTRPFGCAISRIWCLFSKERPHEYQFGSLSNVLENRQEFVSIATGLFFLALPTIIFLALLIGALKLFIAILLATIISFAATRLLFARITFQQLFNCSVYASTILVIGEVVSFFLGIKIPYLPAALYTILLSFSIILMREKKVTDENF